MIDVVLIVFIYRKKYLVKIICVHFKWGITPLRDNYVTDNEFYLIKVYTGMRRGAGTRSRIAFILTGNKRGTGPRELFDGVREVKLHH